MSIEILRGEQQAPIEPLEGRVVAIIGYGNQGAAHAQNLRESGGPDQLLYHLTGDVAGDRLYEMSGTLIGPQDVTVEMWIAPETFELVRVLVTEPEPAAGEPSIWQVDFANFGDVVDIQPPGASEMPGG